MVERKIGEVFRCATGDMVVCVKDEGMCKGCIHAKDRNCRQDKLIGVCSSHVRKDKTSVIFRKIDTDRTIADDIVILERIAEEYPGKTINNIIAQLKSRLS